MLGDWLDDPQRSGLAARELAVAMAVTHLRAGRDVIVPQFLTRREFVDRLHEVAEAEGARFVELTLLDERAAVLGRAQARIEAAGGFSSRDLVAKQESSFESAYDTFVEALAERPDAIVIDAASVDDAYAELVRKIGV